MCRYSAIRPLMEMEVGTDKERMLSELYSAGEATCYKGLEGRPLQGI